MKQLRDTTLRSLLDNYKVSTQKQKEVLQAVNSRNFEEELDG